LQKCTDDAAIFIFPRWEEKELVEMTTPLPATPETPASQTPPPADAMPATWEAFLEKQPAEVKALYTSHSQSLLNTVSATRDERDAFKKQIKELMPKAEKGSELEKSLTEISARLEVSERRASFLEDAVKPEIECRNPGVAWVIAKAQDLFTKNGQPDWKQIKAAAPELFGKVIANANAGNGTGTPPAQKQDMNQFIRSKGGRT
jgi:hypothetical protein